MKRFPLFSLTLASLVGLGCGSVAFAAEEVALRYKSLGRTVAVADLAILAETGDAPDRLGGLLNQANLPPETLQGALNRRFTADVVTLDKTLNSLPGEWLLDQVGEAIHPTHGDAQRQALRAALVLSASDDGELSLLEVLQTYPTETVVLEVDRIQTVFNQIEALLQPIEQWLGETLLEIILRGRF